MALGDGGDERAQRCRGGTEIAVDEQEDRRVGRGIDGAFQRRALPLPPLAAQHVCARRARGIPGSVAGTVVHHDDPIDERAQRGHRRGDRRDLIAGRDHRDGRGHGNGADGAP